MAVSGSAPSASTESAALGCGHAADPAELAAHFAVRREVFVERQGLFAATDRDAHDDDPATLHVVGRCGDHVAGAVRLYPYGPDGLWKGDRLAVLPGDRVRKLGAMLVRFAVATAGERGGTRMVAQIQLANVAFFERLGWACAGPVGLAYGVPHQPVAITLSPGR